MSLFSELKRRNVFRVAAAYLVAGWLVTEVLTTVLPTLGAPDWQSKAVVLVFALAFLPTILFAWVYEVTPDGIRKQRDVDLDASIVASKSHKLEYATIATVIAAILFLAVFGSLPATDPEPGATMPAQDASVAVLPFVNMSDNPDNEYFSDGLTETLLHMLAQIPDLKVAARTSSFSFKGQNRTISEIAATLGVAHVLEGSVQRQGDSVRITAQLIRASDGFHVWSAIYDDTVDDIFKIQDEIAGKVGRALSESILGVAEADSLVGVGTTSTDAYDLYLRALGERATYSYWELQGAEKLLIGALTVDPNFVDAKTELAGNYLQQLETGLMDNQAVYTRNMAITGQVLAVEPDNADARAIRLFTETAVRATETTAEQLREAVTQLKDIVAAEPDRLQPRLLLTRLLQRLQRFDEALDVQQEGLKRDPRNPRILYEIGTLHAALDQPEAAHDALQKSLEIEPAQPNAYAALAAMALQAGDGLDYLRNFLKAVEVDPTDHELPGMIALFLYNLGLVEEGDDFRNRVMAIAPTSEVAYRIELMRAISTGDEEAGIEAARSAIADNVGDRQNAFSGAVQYLLRTAVRRGTVDDELAFIEQHAPGIFDIESDGLPVKYRAAQFLALDAWYTTLDDAELKRRLEQLLAVERSFGVEPTDDPARAFQILALTGETEEAIKLALSRLASESPLNHPGWRRALDQPQYRDIVADARVQAALQRWEEQEADVREQVRAYLADLRGVA
ncbi:MAG: hypothetical protein WD078_08430 [Woeseia sp.]